MAAVRTSGTRQTPRYDSQPQRVERLHLETTRRCEASHSPTQPREIIWASISLLPHVIGRTFGCRSLEILCCNIQDFCNSVWLRNITVNTAFQNLGFVARHCESSNG